jgi:hypothetical protein
MFPFLRLKNGSDFDPRIQEYFTGILFHSTMRRNLYVSLGMDAKMGFPVGVLVELTIA